MNKKKLIITSTVFMTIIVCIIFIQCNSFNTNQNEGKIEYILNIRYTVKIKSDTQENITLYIPVPLKDKGVPSEVINNISSQNKNYSWKKTDTPKGKALNLTGNGNDTLQGHFKIIQEEPVYEYDAALSMAENRSTNFTLLIWKSFQSGPVRITLTYTKEMGTINETGMYIKEIEGLCRDGWNKLDVEETIYS